MNKPIPEKLQEVLFEKSIPGQSLTNPKDQNYAWEKPAKFSSVKDAREDIFLKLLEPKRIQSLQQLMMNKVPVNNIAQLILVEGFKSGQFNPDMALNLLEPTMYMLMAIAEKSGIEPIVDGEDDGEEDDEESINRVMTDSKNMIKEGGRFQDARVRNIQPASVGKDIAEKLENLDVEKMQQSILQKPKPELQNQESLLGKTGV
tara:strand:+ start:685 stop:1293 length:609 start_codon:yes stop_codon:yes gene_type:complete